MDRSPNLDLPFILPSQAQKHVTHNEALSLLDAVVQLSVRSRGLSAPPPSPADGERYIAAGVASGLWAGHDAEAAVYGAGGWTLVAPQPGWLAYVEDEQRLLVYDGADWSAVIDNAINPARRVGINTLADATNKLAVKSDAVLMSHDDVTPGSGDMRLTLNKNAAAGTASLTFQTGWSGRAEFGLAGDDDWHVKVSADGSGWKQALVADRATGQVRFPQGLVHPASGQRPQSFIGLAGAPTLFRIDGLHDQNPRTGTIDAVTAAGTITLTTATAHLFFSDLMEGETMARIWNLSKTPEQSAWVVAAPAADALAVLDPAAIAGWTAGDTIQIGDPLSVTENRCSAYDISPMLISRFGASFRQSGLFAKYYISGHTAVLTDLQTVTTGLSPNGANGSFNNAQSAPRGLSSQGILYIPCSQPSPVSDSNLVYVRETGGPGTIGLSLIGVLGVLAEM
ncbi:DUF2793 domain-containing protein [Hoeflea sp.]|uniref:DUF2793 domain-containing protein n=1 Tax=Hoeflea sp. TaxID=1940281 RepID=UPI0019A4D57F|nr:DUF2793 domain-containing protein [Hoeflea sp.]MBC7285046.1 DUF2793 domain-containing protein [Hoeflea sp.]